MKTPAINILLGKYRHTREYAALSTNPELERIQDMIIASMGIEREGEHEEIVTKFKAEVEDRLFILGFQNGVRFMCECLQVSGDFGKGSVATQ